MFGFEHISFPAVLVAALAGSLWAMLWYSPLMFGRKWAIAMGRRRGGMANPIIPMAFTSLTNLICSLSLAFLIVAVGAGTLLAGVGIGLFIGLGFVATSMLSDFYFHGWQRRLFQIDVWCRVTMYGIMGAILGAWR